MRFLKRTVGARHQNSTEFCLNDQYGTNTRSDVDYLRERIENAESSDETTALIADGSYAREEPAA